MSTNDYFDLSKSWISSLLESTGYLFDHEREKLSLDNKNNDLLICLRSALIIFDHDTEIVWNLDEFEGGYDHEKAKSMLTNAVKENENNRLSGTHIDDALKYTINNVFPKMNPSDSNIVLMLTDGKPSSCYGDIDQNPCQISPNDISKQFQNSNVKFMIVSIGDHQSKKESMNSIQSTFECLYQDIKEMKDSIIISPSYFDLDLITHSIQHNIKSHTCGLNNYQCNINMYPSSILSQPIQFYNNDWNYASYRFVVNDYDLWPYYASIKIQSQCNHQIELTAKLMHYDPITKITNLIKESDQIFKISNHNHQDNDEYKFSFRGSSIDQVSGKTIYNKLNIGQIYVIEFHIIDNDQKCKGLNKLEILNMPQTGYYNLDKYFVDIGSSIAYIVDNDQYQHPIPSQIVHPLVSLCIAERNNDQQQNHQPITTKPGIITTIQNEQEQIHETETLLNNEIINNPTQKPTHWPTRTYSFDGNYRENNNNHNECRPPKYFPSPIEWNKCDENSVEWNIDFTNWFYNEYKDETYIEYEICVLPVPPFNSCKYIGKSSAALSMILFQIPCFCEVCLNEMTQEMKPNHGGYTTEIHQGWLWEYLLYPGECQKFEITLNNYVPMDYGYYKIMGDNRWIEGSIQVPNPCQPSIGFPIDYYYDDNDDDDDKSENTEDNLHENNGDNVDDDICYYDTPFYPDHDCSFVCDEYQDNEWRLEYISNYNDDGNTVFIYHAFVESNIDNFECTKREHSSSQSLSKIYLRLGCDCQYQSKSFLQSMTIKMEPFGIINENYWSWNLDLKDGEMQELKLILKGENMEMGFTEMTLVGSDRRCTSFNMIKAPNPCKNNCNFGEWTKWSSFGECSVECGGGYKYKTRECVSICDGNTKIDNCVGENNHMSPCNTHPCPEQQDIINHQH